MFESKYSKVLTGALIAGIVIIVGVLSFFGFQLIRNYYINKDAADAVERFESEIKNNNTNTQKENTVTNAIAPTIGIENILVDNNSSDTNQRMYKGFPMVGTIEIPAIDLKSPVLEDASASAIEVAVAVYYGPGLNKVGNTVIIGHNYRNGTLFSDLKKVVDGDKVYITDNSGTKVTYIVYKTYTTNREDYEYFDRDTAGKREISLWTCTDDADSAFIVWAKEQ